MTDNDDLRDNLSAAAHLMHGSPEDRFTVTYCPGHMTREEIEGVGFQFGDLAEMSAKYDITKLKDGFNDVNGERVFFVSNPALGELLASDSRMASCSDRAPVAQVYGHTGDALRLSSVKRPDPGCERYHCYLPLEREPRIVPPLVQKSIRNVHRFYGMHFVTVAYSSAVGIRCGGLGSHLRYQSLPCQS